MCGVLEPNQFSAARPVLSGAPSGAVNVRVQLKADALLEVVRHLAPKLVQVALCLRSLARILVEGRARHVIWMKSVEACAIALSKLATKIETVLGPSTSE